MTKNMKILFLLLIIAVAPTIKSEIDLYKTRKANIKKPIMLSSFIEIVAREKKKYDTVSSYYKIDQKGKDKNVTAPSYYKNEPKKKVKSKTGSFYNTKLNESNEMDKKYIVSMYHEVETKKNDSISDKLMPRRHTDEVGKKPIDLFKIPTIAYEETIWQKPLEAKNNVIKKHLYEKKSTTCNVDFRDYRKKIDIDQNLPMIYFVTPTFPRPEQIPELIQLSHTLTHVPRIFWIVADDNMICSEEVATILKRSQLPYAHISSPKPEFQGPENQRGNEKFPQGLATRRAALKFIYKYLNDGVLYFGEDDNTYDLKLFSEIRKTKMLSMIPVGLIGSYGVSSPLVSDGKVVGFLDSWFGGRTFAIDMAGFAINIKHLKKYTTIKYEVGKLENHFLISAGFEVEDIEPLANNCTEVLVWHTLTVKNPVHNVRINFDTGLDLNNHNLPTLLRHLARRNVVKINAKRGVTPKVVLYNKFMMMMRIPLKMF